MAEQVDTGTDELLCEIRDRVAVITLNKPHKKNALGDILTPALRHTLLDLEPRADVGCVLIWGAGDAFCSGGDISGMGGDSGPKRNIHERSLELTRKQEALTGRLYEFSKPTVAALSGAAAGAGLSIALACDVRVASESAFITTAFKNIGLSGDYGASWFLPRLIGQARAKHLFFTAERVKAQQCLEMGLFAEVYSDGEFREQAFTYAKEIAMGPSMALALMKKNLNAGIEQPLRDSLALEASHLMMTGGSSENKEAVKAFMAKRSPDFHK
jgi:enoyl-CoA hydratase/carnithine racemase